MKGKGKCLPVTGRSRCSKCYCCRNVDDFFKPNVCHKVICYEILSVCLRAEKSFYDKYKHWFASALLPGDFTAIVCGGKETCRLFTPGTNVKRAPVLIIIQSHNKTLEFWLVCMKCVSRNLIWIGFHTVHEFGLDWIVKINVHAWIIKLHLDMQK